MRCAPVLVVIALLLCLGCDSRRADTTSAPAKPTSAASASSPTLATASPSRAKGDGDACLHTACEDCVHEGGCYWRKSTKTCSLGKPSGAPETDLQNEMPCE
jgi:hypothetical protein